jgi:molybdopterin converting factor small subunit
LRANLARININFVGLWRVFLGVGSITVDVASIEEAREYVETSYGPKYQEKLKSLGYSGQQSIWDSSNILLNGRNVGQLNSPVLRDGDRIDLISRVAGG